MPGEAEERESRSPHPRGSLHARSLPPLSSGHSTATAPGHSETTEDSQTTARASSAQPEEPRESASAVSSSESSSSGEGGAEEPPPLEEKWQYSAATTLSEQVYRFMVTPQAEESTVRPLK